MGNLFRFSAAALLSLTALGAVASTADAATCRDAHGRFERCPAAVAKKTTPRAAHVAKASATTAPTRKVAVSTTSRRTTVRNAPKHALTHQATAPKT